VAMKINILYVIQDSEECKGSTNAVVMRKKSHFYLRANKKMNAL
jgi:hypothetical protein